MNHIHLTIRKVLKKINNSKSFLLCPYFEGTEKRIQGSPLKESAPTNHFKWTHRIVDLIQPSDQSRLTQSKKQQLFIYKDFSLIIDSHPEMLRKLAYY